MTNNMLKYNYFLKLGSFKSSVVYVLKRATFLKLFVNLFLSKKNLPTSSFFYGEK